MDITPYRQTAGNLAWYTAIKIVRAHRAQKGPHIPNIIILKVQIQITTIIVLVNGTTK